MHNLDQRNEVPKMALEADDSRFGSEAEEEEGR
jgi:hypothetical protein